MSANIIVPPSTSVETFYDFKSLAPIVSVAQESALTPPTPGEARLAAVQDVLDSYVESDPTIQDILALLQRLLKVENTLVNMVKEDTVELKQTCGSFTEGCCFEAPSFCFWTLVPLEHQVVIIEDLRLDARTSSSRLVTPAQGLRFYAAAPLVTSSEQRIGTLCVVDSKPRKFTNEHAAILCNFAELVMRVLEGLVLERHPVSSVLGGSSKRGSDAYNQATAVVDTSSSGWSILQANPAFYALAGRGAEEGLFWDLFAAPGSCQGRAPAQDPGECLTVRCRGKAGFRGPMQAVLRPITTHKLDDAAKLVSMHSRPEAAEEALESDPGFKGLYFLLLTVKEVVKQRMPLPFEGLRLGTALGAGEYAKVYRGVRGGGEKVAVKVVHDYERFLDEQGQPLEAVINGLSVHPNVVRLLDYKVVTSPRKRLWLLLEYCDRGTLADAVDQGWFRQAPSQLSPPCFKTIVATAKQIALGFSYLHAKGIVHGDVSGGNILLQSSSESSEEFVAKIADFGLSRWQTQEKLTEVTGTPSYLAPEVLRGDPPSQASDVYSFGVLLFEMLAGRRAWAGMNTFQITYFVLFQGQSLPVPEGLPPGLASALQQCLSTEPAGRCSFDEILLLLLDVEAALLTAAPSGET